MEFQFLFTQEGLIKADLTEDSFILGFGVENLGPKTSDEYNSYYLPVYLSFGATYNIKSTPDSPIAFELTGSLQYMNYLHPGEGVLRTYKELRSYDETVLRDYWGSGLEVLLFKFFAFRSGFYKSPFNDKFKPVSGIGFIVPPSHHRFHLEFDWSFNENLLDRVSGISLVLVIKVN